MTYLVERLAELRKHLTHLHDLRPRVAGRETLERDLSLHNDVLFSLLMVSQLVIDIAGELSARKGERFDSDVIHALERLPGFRNVVVHEYVGLDLNRVVEALDELSPIEQFLRSAAEVEKG